MELLLDSMTADEITAWANGSDFWVAIYETTQGEVNAGKDNRGMVRPADGDNTAAGT